MKKKARMLLMMMLAFAMTVTMMPQSALPAYAEDSEQNTPVITSGATVLEDGVNTANAKTVYYGESGERDWRVIGYNGNGAAAASGELTLLSAGAVGQVWYTTSGNNNYAESKLKTSIDSYASDQLSSSENAVITTRNLESGNYDGENTDCVSGAEVTGAVLWPLSIKEALSLSSDIRKMPDADGKENMAVYWWWLRSPGYQSDKTSYVRGTGEVMHGALDSSSYENSVNQYKPSTGGGWYDRSVRPAFYLDTDKILFTSASENGKTSGDEGLAEVGNFSGDKWKLTLQYGHDDFAAEVKAWNGSTVTVAYEDAVVEENGYVSAVIKDSKGNVTYYGRLQEVTSSDGTIQIDVTDKLTEGDTLYVFNEQYNGDPETDYASALKAVAFPEDYTYIVTFSDGQGNTLKEEYVKAGNSATAPDDPSREGYIFKGWDKSYENISADTDISALWLKKTTKPLLAKLKAKGSRSLVLTWNSIDGAEGYDVFFVRCGKDNECKLVKTVKAGSSLKWTKSKLNKKKCYKAYVRAWIKVNGKKTYIKKSLTVHAFTSGHTKNYTNPKSVSVKKPSVTLAAGKTSKIKASVTKLYKKKKLISSDHTARLRYKSSNSSVAAVDAKGVITAKSSGSCKIYVIATNGVKTAVSVTVE